MIMYIIEDIVNGIIVSEYSLYRTKCIKLSYLQYMLDTYYDKLNDNNKQEILKLLSQIYYETEEDLKITNISKNNTKLMNFEDYYKIQNYLAKFLNDKQQNISTISTISI